MELSDCCRREAASNLAKNRDIATCDGCGRLLLAYGDEPTFKLTVEELEKRDVGFASGRHGKLWIVAKER